MNRNALLVVLSGLIAVGMGSVWKGEIADTVPTLTWWLGFLVFLPTGLAILVWLRLRWVAMACVVYATVGLALDLATIVQILTADEEMASVLGHSLTSGFLNFLLIIFGGRSFLDLRSAPQRPEFRPPNPPPAS